MYLQGILLVYDITNKWSFDGIDRWIKEIDEVRVKLASVLLLSKTSLPKLASLKLLIPLTPFVQCVLPHVIKGRQSRTEPFFYL